MSRERCLAFTSDLERRDVALLRRWFTDQSELWVPPTSPIRGTRRILALFRAVFRMYDEIHWRVTDVYPVGGERYVYMTDSWGTIGRSTPYRNHVMTLVEFDADGHIRSLSDYFKDTEIFRCGRGARAPVHDEAERTEPA